MVRLIKILLFVGLGVIIAFESERWIDKLKVRLAPSSMTGSVLDKINQRLESNS